MTNWYLYDEASGEIIRWGSCEEADAPLQAVDGLTLALGDADRRFHVVAGQAVAYTEAQLLAKAVRPRYPAQWSNATFSWADGRSLVQRKVDRWEDMKAARATAIDAPLATPYGVFDSYAEARSNITDAVLLAQTLAGIGQPVAIAFTLADNSVATLGLTQMVTVGLMLGSKVQTVRAVATTLRTQIESATTIEQLEAITWPVT